MRSFLVFLKNDSGATAIEYSLIAGLVAIVIITSVVKIGSNLAAIFTRVNTEGLGGS